MQTVFPAGVVSYRRSFVYAEFREGGVSCRLSFVQADFLAHGFSCKQTFVQAEFHTGRVSSAGRVSYRWSFI